MAHDIVLEAIEKASVVGLDSQCVRSWPASFWWPVMVIESMTGAIGETHSAVGQSSPTQH